MKEFALALAAGLVSGGLFVALATGSFGALIFAYLSQVPLFLVGLGLGTASLLVAGAAALLVVGIAGGAAAAGMLAAGGIVPILVLLRQALLNRPGERGVEWYPPGLLVGWLTAMAGLGVTLAGLILASHPEGAEAGVREMLAGALQLMAPPETLPEERMQQLSATFATVFLGSTAVSWMMMMAINGSLAQGVLVGFGRNLRPSPHVSAIEIPRWIYLALGVAILIAVAATGTLGYIARNLAIAFAAAFFFQGLGIVHALVGRWSAQTMSLIVFYLVLIVFGWPVIIVTALGLMDPLLRLRARFGRHDRGKEK